MNSLVLLLFAALAASVAQAQVANMPPNVQERLAEVGPGWGKDIRGNIAKTLEVYTPLLAAAPKDGVTVTRDLAYGADPRNRLDIFRPEGKSGMPVVVFIHGGAYVAGERSLNEEVYGNVPMYFARQGMLGVNATYRLAPAAKWPAAAEDVAAMVRWLKTNVASQGGDPNRIYLIGHSAGATHVASYAFIRSLQSPEGTGLAGIVLMSGRYLFDPRPDDPNLKNFQAYFGADRAMYPQQSPINHVKTAAKIPTHIVVAEYDNPDLDTQGALLLAAYCERDRACPRFTRLEKHNHLSMTFQFNTRDDALGRDIVEFIKRGR
ncbi:MAG: alpha/beta hydrolase [Betaproteobacteria bacterium]